MVKQDATSNDKGDGREEMHNASQLRVRCDFFQDVRPEDRRDHGVIKYSPATSAFENHIRRGFIYGAMLHRYLADARQIAYTGRALSVITMCNCAQT